MNWFLAATVVLYFCSAGYDYFAGNPLRSALFVFYGLSNIVMYFMEV
jgi:hypothetical protein